MAEREFIPLNIAVLVVSDSRTEKTDKSGKLLERRLSEAGHQLFEKKIVTDDIHQIRSQVAQWTANDKVNAVLITGGTDKNAGEQLIAVLTSISEVKHAALIYLPWLIVSPLICVWCFLLDGIFIGAVRGLEMRNSMLISTFLIFIPAWYLLQFLGNHGLWLAFLIFFIARGTSLGWYYFKIEKCQPQACLN